MHSSNLFSTLRTLNKEEFKRFGDMVRSPFFNTNQTLVSLYDLIKKYFPDLTHKALDKRAIFKKIYQNEEYNDNRMRLLTHRMNLLAEEFLLQTSIKESKSWPKIFLLGEFKKRRLLKAYSKHLVEARKINFDENKNTNEFYFVQYTLEQNNIAAQITKNLDANEKALMKAQLSLTNESINCFMIATVLKNALFAENIRYRMKADYKPGMLDIVLEHLKSNDYSAHPIVMIYYYLNLLILEPDAFDNYHKVKQIFFENEEDLHLFDVINIYINLENYLWKLYRRGITDRKDELFELYMRRLKKNKYKLGGYMPNQIYKRIVRVALMNGDTEYAEKFIKKYKSELNPEFKTGVYNFACSLCSFHEGDYGKALEYLAIAQNEDISHKIDVKNLTLFINYDQQDFESLRLGLDSYRHFIGKNMTISDQVKNRASTVIRFLNKLMRLNSKYDEFEVNKLKQNIEESTDLENREWFIERAHRLKAN